MSAWSRVTLQRCVAPALCFSRLTPLQLQGSGARETWPGMRNNEGGRGISQAGGNRRFFVCVITQECHSSLCERFLILNGP